MYEKLFSNFSESVLIIIRSIRKKIEVIEDLPHDLENKVKSPGGTTEAGLNSLNNDSFDTIILNAIRKATQRSAEITKELTNE